MKKFLLPCLLFFVIIFGKANALDTNCLPVPANCIPVSAAICCGIELSEWRIDTITRNLDTVTVSYLDFSCVDSFNLNAGVSYSIFATTGFTYAEHLALWLDMNNDGDFSPFELLYRDDNLSNHAGGFTIPNSTVFNVPIRMRISDSYFDTTSCLALQMGNSYDYGVRIFPSIGVNDFYFEDKILLYPNPIKNNIKIEGLNNFQEYEYKITDLTGRIEIFGILSSGEIETSDLKNGSHLISLYSQHTKINKRFIKID